MADGDYQHISVTVKQAALVATIEDTQLRDAAACYAVRDEILAAIEAAPTEHLLVDLSKVEFVGSIGFLAFLGVRRQMSTGRIFLCGMSEGVRDMFRACALTSNDPGKTAPFIEADSIDAAQAAL